MTVLLKMARAAINYHNKHGGICPNCKIEKAFIVHTHPWLDDTKLRYHKCEFCNFNFTSLEDAQPSPEIVIAKPTKKRKAKKKAKNRSKRK